MTNGNGLLPPCPLIYGCNEYMSRNFSLDNNEILNAFGDFIGVIYNATKDTICYDINDNLLPYMPDKFLPTHGIICRTCTVVF